MAKLYRYRYRSTDGTIDTSMVCVVYKNTPKKGLHLITLEGELKVPFGEAKYLTQIYESDTLIERFTTVAKRMGIMSKGVLAKLAKVKE